MATNGPFEAPQALCLDFDGTLVDTRPMWEAAYLHVAKARALTLPENWWATIAGKSMDASAIVFGVHQPAAQQQVAKELVETALALVAHYPPIVLPGAAELFVRAQTAGVPVCIVTSTWSELAGALAHVAGFPSTQIVGGDQVQHGKPSPDIYQRACTALGVSAKHSVAVEDSPSGVAAAYTAGLSVYGLGTHAVTDTSRLRLIGHLDAVQLPGSIQAG